jgi:hypothetical protein
MQALVMADHWVRFARPPARHGTARHGTARHGTARHGTARHGSFVWRNAMHQKSIRLES